MIKTYYKGLSGQQSYSGKYILDNLESIPSEVKDFIIRSKLEVKDTYIYDDEFKYKILAYEESSKNCYLWTAADIDLNRGLIYIVKAQDLVGNINNIKANWLDDYFLTHPVYLNKEERKFASVGGFVGDCLVATPCNGGMFVEVKYFSDCKDIVEIP